MSRDYEKYRLRTRPAPEMVARLRELPTAFLADVLVKIGVINFGVKGLSLMSPATKRAVGPAVTMQLAPTNGTHSFNEAPYIHIEIMEQAEPGDVIVMAAGAAPYAFWGDHMTQRAMKAGLEAGIVDGYVRDVSAIRELAYPVFALGATHESFVGHLEPISYNLPVVCGGAVVKAGDLIVGDEDGVIVVHQEVFSKVLTGIGQVEDLEHWITNAMGKGASSAEIYEEVHRRLGTGEQ
jgi:4-hydroxy-4-methyl-2-oxoglutarate aldolase